MSRAPIDAIFLAHKQRRQGSRCRIWRIQQHPFPHFTVFLSSAEKSLWLIFYAATSISCFNKTKTTQQLLWSRPPQLKIFRPELSLFSRVQDQRVANCESQILRHMNKSYFNAGKILKHVSSRQILKL